MLHNPFGPSLPLDRFKASLTHHSDMLDQVMPKVDINSESSETLEDKQEAQSKSRDSAAEPTVTLDETKAAKTPAEVGWDGSIEELQALVASLELAVDFSKQLTSSMPTLVNLLASSTVSDVQESIALLLTCKQFEVVGAPQAIRKMITLIFARDQGNLIVLFLVGCMHSKPVRGVC